MTRTRTLLTRRRFFQALAASALAAGVPLPVGFPKNAFGRTELAPVDAYIGEWIILDGHWRVITDYNPATRTVTLSMENAP